MADKNQLALICQGVLHWNTWREEHYSTEVELSGADFSGAKLSGAYLIRTDFTRADLIKADLSGAKLSWADFSGADLIRADFNRANLSGATLSRARIGGTIFGALDLRTVKGLDRVNHQGPSTIGTDTLERSQGDLPPVFLERAGLSNTFVEYARSLVLKPIEYYTCFISYSHEDQAFVERLYADLQQQGIRCWYAPEDLKPGNFYRRGIDEAIRLYGKFLLVLSEHSVESQWVEFEVEAALDKEQRLNREVLFPIRLDECVMTTTQAWAAGIRRQRHIGDFRCWKAHDAYQQVFTRLVRDLARGTMQSES